MIRAIKPEPFAVNCREAGVIPAPNWRMSSLADVMESAPSPLENR